VLEVRLLGPLEVRDGERVVDVRRRKERALLAALALRAGAAVSTDRLVDELWGEDAPKTAKHALENYVSQLRKALGSEVISTRPSGYALELDPARVDVVRFEQLVREASGAGTEQRAELLGLALSLVRGPPLADLVLEPFAPAEIRRLEELELAAREELVDAELELGRHAEVVTVLEPLVAAHPYRERVRAQLMLALYRSGRQADALSAYQDARNVLVEELGIDPGEDLQELERAILRQDASLRPPRRVPPKPAPAAAVTSAPRRPARKTVTVLVAELANAPALADVLDPEPLRAILDRYTELTRTVVQRHGGSLASLAGDTTLAVFGVPEAHEDDALRAVRAAFEMRERVGVLNDGLLPEHGLFLELRSAVATGEVLVKPGSDELVTGRAVAEAEQLGRRARTGQILLAGSTHPLVRVVVGAEEVPPDEAGGIAGAFRLVELLPDMYGRALRLDSPLVGRRRQLAALAGAFESAVAEQALYLFTLLGQAGVGKSRLVREFADGVEGVATVLLGRCPPYGEAITYWALSEALHDAGLPEPELGDEPASSVRVIFERLAHARPLVVLLDDVHWAEAAFLDLIEAVAESARESPILLVCVARPELLDSRPGWAGGQRNASSVLLEPLSETESERLMDNLLGESDLDETIRDYVVRTAEGNPLFVEELLATLVDRDVLRREAGRWTTTEVAAIPLPPTIQALIAARIDRLPEGERTMLELAAVGGRRTFHRDVVAELAPDELRADVDALLLALVRKELVRPQPAQEHGFSFRHQLIRDAAYGSLPMQVRAEMHERLAELAGRAERGGPEVEDLVRYHRDQAQRHRAALGSVGSNVKPV
jgi:DNA-binding SARP family transcriptional activator